MAGSRGRSSVAWFFICFLTGLIGIILLAVSGPVRPSGQIYTQHAIAQAGFDRRRWETLKDVDPEIAAAASEVRQYGSVYEDMLADKYLSLNDKSYLQALVAKLKESAQSDTSPVKHGDKGQLGNVHYRRLNSGEYVITKGKNVGKSFASYAELENYSRSA